ncbi:MAG: hypothetical protein E6G22_10890 [Actinobacteria bacterium]|nr:MAG: hypothetical protein E6G22_10890 [Actinomycetota bacterium]
MSRFQVAHQLVDLDRERIEKALERVLPEPIQEHYVVVRGRRYPPKQVITCATGLDRADFTTHQARRILLRLGFTASRVTSEVSDETDPEVGLPHGGRQAAALAPHAGRWIALGAPTEVLVAAETPQEVLGWLARHGRRAEYGMFRVPARDEEAEGAAPL